MAKKLLLRGPLLTRSGYGEQTRFAMRALRTRPDLFDIFIHPLQWGATSWTNEYNAERSWIDEIIEKTANYIQEGGQFDISVQVTIPNEWEKLAPLNIGYTAGIETTKVAYPWIEKGNLMDHIIVVSQHSKNVYQDTEYVGESPQGEKVSVKLMTPVDYVNYPVKTYDELPEVELDLSCDINFLVVAQFGPRKNLTNTLKWFVEEFYNEDVGLVLKSNIQKNCLLDRTKLYHDIAQFLKESSAERKCKIYLLHGDMTDEEMHALYLHPKIKALVALPHGEGYGLPIFEAAYSGLPVVATGWSGQLDFLVDPDGTEHFYNVEYDLQPVQDEVVWEGVIIKESMWAYPKEASAKKQLRLCYLNIQNKTGADPCEYALKLGERFQEETLYKNFVSQIEYFIVDEEDELAFFERENTG
jgi:glycosyltransferase involved in cell wall biosynthesis